MTCTSRRVLLRSNPTCNMRTGPPSVTLAGSHRKRDPGGGPRLHGIQWYGGSVVGEGALRPPLRHLGRRPLRVYDHDWPGRVHRAVQGDGAEQEAADGTAAVAADDQEIRALGAVDEHLSRGAFDDPDPDGGHGAALGPLGEDALGDVLGAALQVVPDLFDGGHDHRAEVGPVV